MKKWILPLMCLAILFSSLTACANKTANETPANQTPVNQTPVNQTPTNQTPTNEINADEIDWENIVLNEVLPAPQSNLMKISLNDKKNLHVDVYTISMNQFMEYIRLCENAGFTVDANRGGSTLFNARNQDGYVLSLTYSESEDKITINLKFDAPPVITTPSLNAEEIYDKCASAVFYIEIYDRNGNAIASGSGVFITADGKALTNHHVVEDAYSAKAVTNDGKTYNITGFYDAQASIDMALIQVEGNGFPFLNMGDSTAITSGQTVFAIGSPKGLDDTISQGIISNANRVIDGLSYIQMTAPISSGSSGGALINNQGLLIGLNTATYLNAQNLNLAVPIHLYNQLASQTLQQFPINGGVIDYSGAALSFNSSLSIAVGQTGTVTVSADPGNCDEDVTIRCESSDESIADPYWDDWDGWNIDLYVTGKSAGTATITITLLVSDTEEVLVSKTITITVSDASKRELAFFSLRDWIIANANTTSSGDPAYCQSFTKDSSTVYFYLIWEEADNQIAINVFEELSHTLILSTTYLTQVGADSTASLYIKGRNSDETIFCGFSEYTYASFSESSVLSFDYYESTNLVELPDAAEILSGMMLEGLAFADWILDEHLPEFSISDFGFTQLT